MNRMLGWALEPAPEEMLLHLVERGEADARSWATQHGLLQVLAELRGGAAGAPQQQQQATA